MSDHGVSFAGVRSWGPQGQACLTGSQRGRDCEPRATADGDRDGELLAGGAADVLGGGVPSGRHCRCGHVFRAALWFSHIFHESFKVFLLSWG